MTQTTPPQYHVARWSSLGLHGWCVNDPNGNYVQRCNSEPEAEALARSYNAQALAPRKRHGALRRALPYLWLACGVCAALQRAYQHFQPW